MRTFSYLISIFAWAFFMVEVDAQICKTDPPSLIQNSLIVGACSSPYTAADQIVRDSSQIKLTGVTTFSVSSWVKISATGSIYSLFRLTEDQATTTPTNDKAIRLTLFIDRGVRQITINYSKTGVFQVVDNQAFAFQDNNWMFLFVSYNSLAGEISYYGWHPNFTPANDISFAKHLTGIGASFHTPLLSVAKLELLYWGTNNKFCGSINRFVYYSSYQVKQTAPINEDWMIQALTDGSKAEQNLLYLRLEYSDPSQNILDFSNQAVRNDAVLGLTSSAEPSDPAIALSSAAGLTLQTGKIVTIGKHKWDGQKGVVISFWIRYPAALTITSDADATDGVNDVVLFSKQTGTNIFRILTNASNQIKIVINNQVYTAAKVLAANAWSQVIVSLALYTDVSSYYNYYIFNIFYHDKTSSNHQKLYTNVIWDETIINSITIGSILNNFTGNIQMSQLKIESGLGVYVDPGCQITSCDIAFAKFSTNKCLKCTSPNYEQNGLCFSGCDTSAFGLTNSNILTCSSCSSTCTYCTGTTGSETCTACATNYYLNSPSCVSAAGCAPKAANPNTGMCDNCGNSTMNGGEFCDDGNFNDYDGCTNCIVDPGYYCNNATPPSKCVLACGNGTVDTNEQCDDGNQIDSDGCTSCIIDIGYSCSGAPSSCKSLCGNGVLDINEECDDGGNTPNDGCTNCLVDIGYTCPVVGALCTSQCANGAGGRRDSNEQCDNNNAAGCTNCTIDAGYTCSGGSSNSLDTCTLTCPDGKKQDNEECDDNNSINGDGCSSTCKVETGWFCTNSTPSSPSVCTQISTIPIPCGDGIRLPTEACDSPVGCNPTCTAVLPGFTCQGGSLTGPDTCTAICGDGKLLGTEECDDGNLLVGDGCDQNCKIETNYYCTSTVGALSTCSSLCGNGVLDPNEECDDENQNSGDGCSSVCKVEIGYSCTQIVAGGRDSCFLCATNCLQCTSKSIKDCDICFPNYFKNPVTGSCDKDCSDGYFIDVINQACSSCYDYNCKRCTSQEKSKCVECSNDTFIAEGDCYQSCPYGFYPTLNPVLGNECTRCPFPCAACTHAGDCQACSDLYYLDGETQTCKLCGMDPHCFQCDIDSKECLKCDIGYKVNGSSCEPLPSVCGDGYFQPSSEKCDDGNTDDGDGCSSACKIENNYGCILKSNEGPSICFEKRPTLVTGKQSKIDDNLIFINFERELQKIPKNITQSDIIIKIAGLKSSNFNYTMEFVDSQTIEVRLNYTKTVHNLDAYIDFSKSFKNKIEDIYNYTLTTKFEPFYVTLPYYIHYTDQEQQSAVAVSWVFVALSIILMGPMFAYLYSFGQGRVFKFIEVIQVVGLMRGMYSIFSAIPTSSDDEVNFEEKDNLTIQRQLMNSSFIHSLLGTIIMSYLILSVVQGINLLLYRFIEIDQITQITEKIKEFMQWDAYIKLFDFIFYYVSISIFLSIQSYSFATPLSIVNLVISILSLIGVLALGGILIKKYVRYQKLHKRTDWFEKYQTLFDGLKFNIKRAKIYIIYPYINKFVYSGVLVFLHDQPFLQIVACAGVRAINILVIIISKPFHFNFMQRRDIASELFLILMIMLCLNCTDDNSEQQQKRIMAIIFVILPFLFIFAYSALYLWTVTQEDIYFDPINIVPLQANPEDWMSQQQDNSKQGSSKKGDDDEDEVAEPPKKNQVIPLNNNEDKSGSDHQDDYNIGNQNEKFIEESEHNDDDDIFAAHTKTNTRINNNLRSQNQKSGSSMGRNIKVEDDGYGDDESQQNEINNYQR